MQKSRCTDDDFRELILVYYCSFILYSVVEIEREFHLQLEENAKIIFWPYINNFDFCRVWGCEIYRNSRQCQFRMEVYFVAVNELEDNKLLVLHGAMGISIFNVNKIVHAKCSL